MGIYTKDSFCELSLFSGAGGGLLATKWFLGWKTVCYVEWEKYCVQALQARIRDNLLDDAPIWDNARTFNGRPWRGLVDIITAGFPCQPFSTAGKRKGKDDDRNMWPDTIRIIREVRPGWVLLENVNGLRCCRRKKTDPPTQEASYLGQVFSDLAESGYDARWKVLSAAEVGAPHKRDRIFIMAYSSKVRCTKGQDQYGAESRSIPTTENKGWMQQLERMDRVGKNPRTGTGIDTRNFRNNDGMARRVDRLKAIGNGQVPLVVAAVWNLLTGDWMMKDV